tara:strand:- start:436 stop:756 length:321 start_codon:yes stop_codon:yes gene_type:complete
VKLSKSQLKQLIKEEVTADEALLDAIQGLASRIEELDVSIDYLASAFVGVPAYAIKGTQRNIGRAAYVPKITFGGAQASPADVSEIKNMIREELELLLKENRNESQ